jgi:hypothetical protein
MSDYVQNNFPHEDFLLLMRNSCEGDWLKAENFTDSQLTLAIMCRVSELYEIKFLKKNTIPHGNRLEITPKILPSSWKSQKISSRVFQSIV